MGRWGEDCHRVLLVLQVTMATLATPAGPGFRLRSHSSCLSQRVSEDDSRSSLTSAGFPNNSLWSSSARVCRKYSTWAIGNALQRAIRKSSTSCWDAKESAGSRVSRPQAWAWHSSLLLPSLLVSRSGKGQTEDMDQLLDTQGRPLEKA